MRRPSIPPTTSPARAVAAFLGAGLLVLTLVAGVLSVVLRNSAVDEAIWEARALTALQAEDVVEPLLSDAALRPGRAHDQLDRVVRDKVLDRQVLRVKLWDAQGRIVYSDDESVVGKRFDLHEEELRALGPDGQPFAEVSGLDDPENVGEEDYGQLLAVYHGVETVEGTPLLYETYQPYDRIVAASRRQWVALLPVLLGGLALLWLAQAPLAWRLATRLQASQAQREQLLVSTLAANDRERQRIAADLHDGVVQGLSGASYTLSAAASRAATRGDPDGAEVLHATAVDLRRSVRELRSLVVTITPPGSGRQPLLTSLHDLVAPLQDRGIRVSLELDDVPVDLPTRDLVLRAAQEAVRNVLRHADARAVVLRLCADGTAVVLEVRDDGTGFGPGAGARTSMGLTLLGGLAEQDGGSLAVDSAPGQGTRLVLRLPQPRDPVLP